MFMILMRQKSLQSLTQSFINYYHLIITGDFNSDFKRKMVKLLRETHRFFTELVIETKHIMVKIYKSFLEIAMNLT